MHGIAERIENSGDFPIDGWFVAPDVTHRQSDIFGKGTGAIHADALGMRTEVTPARQAIAAASTHDVPFAADDFVGVKIVYVGTNFDNLADEFVADGHRHRNGGARPFIPFVDVEIGATDASVGDADEDVVDTDGRFGNVEEGKAGRAVGFDESFHIRIVEREGKSSRLARRARG